MSFENNYFFILTIFISFIILNNYFNEFSSIFIFLISLLTAIIFTLQKGLGSDDNYYIVNFFCKLYIFTLVLSLITRMTSGNPYSKLFQILAVLQSLLAFILLSTFVMLTLYLNINYKFDKYTRSKLDKKHSDFFEKRNYILTRKENLDVKLKELNDLYKSFELNELLTINSRLQLDSYTNCKFTDFLVLFIASNIISFIISTQFNIFNYLSLFAIFAYIFIGSYTFYKIINLKENAQERYIVSKEIDIIDSIIESKIK